MRTVKRIESAKNLRCTKYRRTKNLVKKSVEISTQCEIDIVLIIFDKKYNRFREVHTNRGFTLDTVNQMMRDEYHNDLDKANTTHELSPKYKRVYARDLLGCEEDDHDAEDDDALESQDQKSDFTNLQLSKGHQITVDNVILKENSPKIDKEDGQAKQTSKVEDKVGAKRSTLIPDYTSVNTPTKS